MHMNKLVVVLVCLVLASSLVFAAAKNNSITSFNASVNSSSDQLVINTLCKAQTIGTITDTYGSRKDIICQAPSFMNVPETVTFNGGVPSFPYKVTFSIPTPCDTCSRTLTINAADTPTSNDTPNDPLMSYAVVFIIIIVIVVIFLVVFSKYMGIRP